MGNVAKLPRRSAPPAAPIPPDSRVVAPRSIALPPAPPLQSPPPAPDRFAGIDRASAERLKRGRQRIEARLDLHGLTQEEAHRVVGGFIRDARAAGKRCVLVITGRGSLGGGVLRAAVPRWLAEAELRPLVLAIATAQPRDGGSGALYVMLRRLPSVRKRPAIA